MVGIFAAAFSYVAALMGAGFASGQEVVTYFVVFGKYAIVGIVISSLLIGMFGAVISECAMRSRREYSGIISENFSGWVLKAVKALTFVYSMSVLSVMLACFGEVGNVLCGLPRLVGVLILALVCSVLLMKGNETALKLNGVIGGVIFIGAVSVCLYLLGYREHQTFGGVGGAAVSGAVYAGYNLISVGTVLANGRVFLKRKNDGILCGVIAGVMIFILLIVMWAILSIYYGKINLGELPMLTLTMRESNVLSAIYAVVIAAAVLTTAMSSGMCAAEYIREYASGKKSVLLILGTGIAMSGAGFSSLIDTLYRWCGYAGIVVAFLIMVKQINNALNEEKSRD